MKRIILTVTISILVLMLCACNGGGNSDAAPNPSEPVQSVSNKPDESKDGNPLTT
jgi:hypothetical protein